MDVKEWLSKYYGLEAEAHALYIALQKQGSEEALLSESQTQEITGKLKIILDQRDAMQNAVNSLEDPLERCILRMRYFDVDSPRLTPWRSIALWVCNNDAPKDIRYVHRYHRIALDHLAEIVKNGGYTDADTDQSNP